MQFLAYLEGSSLAGAERVLRQIVERARTEGIEVSLASCGSAPAPLGEAWRSEGGRYDYLLVDVSPQSAATAIPPEAFNGWWRSLLADVRPDVLLANDGGYPWHSTCLTAVRIAAAEGVARRYLAIHSTPEPGDYDAAEREADRAVADACTAIVLGSAKVAECFAAERPVLAPRLTTIAYGVADPGEPGNTGVSGLPQIGMAADLRDHRKGQQVLVDAMMRLPVETPWQAVVAGDGPALAALQRSAAGLPVMFPGRLTRDAMDAFYRALAIYVLPSLQEGLSLTILEAMAHGLPVVASDVGGHGEAVVDGETGFLVPPGDSAALSDAIRRLLRDQGLRTNMGQQARARFEAHFSLEGFLQRWMALLRD